MTPPGQRWWHPFRVLDEVTIIHVDLAPAPAQEEAAFNWLDRNERDRWRRFRVNRARREFALCRAALRANLCERLACTNDQLAFGFLEHGKPYAIVDGVPSTGSFNVSHSGKHGLIAFALQGQLGVDVEERVARRDLDGIGEAVFGPRELSALSELTGNGKIHLFFTLWTIKEALIKAIGTGFSLNPSRFEVPSGMLRGTKSTTFRFPHAPRTRWRIEDLGESRFAAALAYELGSPADPAANRSARETVACADSAVESRRSGGLSGAGVLGFAGRSLAALHPSSIRSAADTA